LVFGLTVDTDWRGGGRRHGGGVRFSPRERVKVIDVALGKLGLKLEAQLFLIGILRAPWLMMFHSSFKASRAFHLRHITV
jgi:hypothetical protein